MSKGSDQGRFFGATDSYYDPDFTVQISSKMYVPDKISVIGGDTQEARIFPDEDRKKVMQVPERILVAGGDEHIGGREPLPELRMESDASTEPQKSTLTTPPRYLTLDEYSYPGIDAANDEKQHQQQKNHNTPAIFNGVSELNESSFTMAHAPEEEVVMLRQQVKLLGRRVIAIERENQQRQQREIILYSVSALYFILKGLAWLHRHF